MKQLQNIYVKGVRRMEKPDYAKIAVRIVDKVVKVIKKEVLKGSSEDESIKEKDNGKSVEDSS